MSRRFEDKVAVVTGAGGGIGRALALGIAAEGAAVACLDISADDAATTAAAARDFGVGAVAQTCDVAVESELVAAVERVDRELGPIDVLLANAGGSRSESVPFLELTMDRWQTMVDRNLTSAFVSCLVVGRHMAEHGGGAIVVVSSQLGEVVRKHMAHYCAAKGGVKQLIRAAAVDLIGHGIRVNGIAPGPTMTPGTRELFERPEVAEANRRFIPLGRIAESHELVGGALYLASEAAAFAVGTTLVIDGGYTIV
ncbi:MAG: SDR family oxidoreductase [Nitriliruptorales bacterium]|nr:SDR family oxidoreductase [Nitriliruptorales bacterium]